MAHTMGSKKAKGKRLENFTADELVRVLGAYGVKASPTAASGAIDRFKGDIFHNLPLSIECKNQETVQLWKWWAQAQGDAGSKTPVLVFTRNREPEPLAVIKFSDLLVFLEYAIQCGWASEHGIKTKPTKDTDNFNQTRKRTR